MMNAGATETIVRTGEPDKARLAALLKRGYQAFASRKLGEAGAAAREVLTHAPRVKEAHFLVGLIASESRDTATAVRAFKSVVGLDEGDAAGWAQLARLYAMLGQYGNAETALERAVALSPAMPIVMDTIGGVFSALGDQAEALRWFDKATAKEPGHPQFAFNRANALLFLGRFDEARAALDIVLKAHPDMPRAHWMIAGMSKAKDRKHIEEMAEYLGSRGYTPLSQSFLLYATGKELEDLEDWDAAFEAFEAGAAAKRAATDYDEAVEEQLFAALKSAFTTEWLAAQKGKTPADAPIFIVGQPRTGTTLVERIIAAHGEVEAAGELQQFAMSMKRLSGLSTPLPMSAEVVEAIAAMDASLVGHAYIEATKPVRGSKSHFIDKMPVNYLYAPLIAAALPNAKIVHVRRDPMDSCFASYKQLFAEAYPHSYNQQEMARHHARYLSLMTDWRALLGDRLIEIEYEKLVTDTEAETRRLIAALGLAWDDACLDFFNNDGAVTTASAAQVREPAHTRSVGRWRRYEDKLSAMRNELLAQGVAV
ncbi:tetratricopeptide repeat-containing sulfotransferase family protein [Gimibacter soli]|uniref:Sulfotransferase n=1 Tax=Gimibacter soli TaxID=3024400 RepID=A0AAF0BJG7_9PROT|nr:tetratricopeptide repeat-containing sulfotransferase family protein [Gimibacter soli]WCL53099.1 sulfotransferase [Gimibacter soli]